MPGIGIIANMAGIFAGGILGTLGGRLLTERYQKTVMAACAIAIIFMAAGGTMKEMLQIGADGQLACTGINMMLGSLVAGALIGEIVNLEDKMESFGEWLKAKSGNSGDAAFVDAFVTASLTVCVGAMAVIGSINDRLLGDPSVLFVKTVLDFVIIMIMASTMGKGCTFSAISVGIFQGCIFLLAGFLEPVMTKAALANLSYVGNILIFCVGVNLLGPVHIRVANFMPSLVIAVAWSFWP